MLSQETELLRWVESPHPFPTATVKLRPLPPTRWRFLCLITSKDREEFFQYHQSEFDFEVVVLPLPTDADPATATHQVPCQAQLLAQCSHSRWILSLTHPALQGGAQLQSAAG